MEFNFEILDAETINIRYNYGGEWFEFNLFYKESVWMLHPFDAVLLGNPEMCRLVVSDLLAHKPFQVMLAKERIRLSTIRTTVDVSGEYESLPDRGGFDAGRDFGADRPGAGRGGAPGSSGSGSEPDFSRRSPGRNGGGDNRKDSAGTGKEPTSDELEDWIRNNSLEDILKQEKEALELRVARYNQLLQKMFYENLGPGNDEFDKVQMVSRLYKEAVAKLNSLIGSSGA